MSRASTNSRALIAGATGFVGRHLRVALEASGVEVRLGTRRPGEAKALEPGSDWVFLDMDRPRGMTRVLQGCHTAYFLVHQVGTRSDYTSSETKAARDFARAAEEAGCDRIVYLGGVVPETARSRHLESRRATGEILRAGKVPCTELRAAMIIGQGSASWRMVTDLADRLPAMVLPRWLGNHSWPVGIDDVVHALVAAAQLAEPASGWFDIPGPERLSHREMLLRVAKALGHKPVMVGVPVLSPRLSSYWIGAVTSVDLRLAQELVQGLVTDLDPTGLSFWAQIKHQPMDLGQSVALALADRRSAATPSSATRQRMERIGALFTRKARNP